MQNDILFVGATHGDESIGVDVLSEIASERNDFDWIIGSEHAFQLNEREFEGDLNRAAPGNPDASQYSARRAAEIIALSQKYKYTIDIHGSEKDNGLFIIMTNPTEDNMKLAALLDIERVVVWKNEGEMQGPLSEFFPCGLEIECGIKTDPIIIEKLKNAVLSFVDHHHEHEMVDWKNELNKKEIYVMTGPIPHTTEYAQANLQEFQEATVDNDTFTPVFVGSYDYDNILGYKLKRIDWPQALSTTKK